MRIRAEALTEKNRPKNRKQNRIELNGANQKKNGLRASEDTSEKERNALIFTIISTFQLKDFNRLALTLQSQLPL